MVVEHDYRYLCVLQMRKASLLDQERMAKYRTVYCTGRQERRRSGTGIREIRGIGHTFIRHCQSCT